MYVVPILAEYGTDTAIAFYNSDLIELLSRRQYVFERLLAAFTFFGRLWKNSRQKGFRPSDLAWWRTRLYFNGQEVPVTFQDEARCGPRTEKTRPRPRSRRDGTRRMRRTSTSWRASSSSPSPFSITSCGFERSGHSTASPRSSTFCCLATRVFRQTLLWR